MSVYVDDMRAPYRNMVMCHMSADTHGELVEMADRIGVARKWIQMPGHYREHFDICQTKRAKAISLGAKEVKTREAVKMMMVRRKDRP